MVITVADVLKHAEIFEKSLADFYAQLAQDTHREGVRLLTDYMSRHRVRIHEALSRLDQGEVARVRAQPIRYEPQAADCHCFDSIDLSPDATAAEVLDVAVTLDACLVNLYSQALRQTDDVETIEVFSSLIRFEERDEIELKKIKAMDYF